MTSSIEQPVTKDCSFFSFKMVFEQIFFDSGCRDRVDICDSTSMIFAHAQCPFPKRLWKSLVFSEEFPLLS